MADYKDDDDKAMQGLQAPLNQKIQQIEKRQRIIDEKIKDKAIEIKETSKNCKQKQDELEQKDKQIEEVQQSLRVKRDAEQERQKKIGNIRKMIEDWEKELSAMTNQENIQPEMDSINTDFRRIQDDKANIESEMTDLRMEKDNLEREKKEKANRIKQFDNLMNLKEEKLKRMYSDTYNAVVWLKENKDRFKNRVCQPMMLEINMKDQRHAKYVENHIPMNDMKAFVFESQEDMQVFLKEVRDKQNLRVNTVCAPQEPYAEQRPKRPITDLKQYGFFSYLRELFDAPYPVMNYLCYQYKVHEVPVGTEQTRSMIEKVIKETDLRQMYTAEEKYVTKKSVYSQKLISSNVSLKGAQFLTVTVDAEERQQVVDQLKEIERKCSTIETSMEQLAERQRSLDRRDNELRLRKKTILEMKTKKRQLEQKISTKYDSLNRLEQDNLNLEEVQQQANNRIKNLNVQKAKLVKDLLELMKECTSLSIEKVELALQSTAISSEKNKIESDYG